MLLGAEGAAMQFEVPVAVVVPGVVVTVLPLADCVPAEPDGIVEAGAAVEEALVPVVLAMGTVPLGQAVEVEPMPPTVAPGVVIVLFTPEFVVVAPALELFTPELAPVAGVEVDIPGVATWPVAPGVVDCGKVDGVVLVAPGVALWPEVPSVAEPAVAGVPAGDVLWVLPMVPGVTAAVPPVVPVALVAPVPATCANAHAPARRMVIRNSLRMQISSAK